LHRRFRLAAEVLQLLAPPAQALVHRRWHLASSPECSAQLTCGDRAGRGSQLQRQQRCRCSRV
jgi:hypothetical protein